MTSRELYQPRETKPRFFYGYIVVVAAFFVLMLSFGLQNTFGIFFKPLLTEFGWTRAVTSGAFSLSMVMYGILSIIMGGLNDRFGPRMVVTLAGFFVGLGYLLMSQTNAVWQLYLFFGVMTGIGLGGTWGPLLSTVARWFVRRRGLMTGIVLSGMGVGTLVASPVLSRMIAAYDWRLSYVVMGSIALVVIVLAAQFLRRDPARKGLLPYGEVLNGGKQQNIEPETKSFPLKEAAKTAQFWLFSMMFFFRGFFVFAVLVHIVPHAIELGISATSAANILALSSGVGIIGNLVLGSLGDRIGNRWVNIIGFILISASLFWLVLADELWELFLFAIAFGFAQGGMSTSASPLLARLFGLGSHGLLFGIVALGFRVGAGIGPLVTGYIFDLTGSYQLAFLASAVFAVVGLIMTVLLKPTTRLGGRI